MLFGKPKECLCSVKKNKKRKNEKKICREFVFNSMLKKCDFFLCVSVFDKLLLSLDSVFLLLLFNFSFFNFFFDSQKLITFTVLK